MAIIKKYPLGSDITIMNASYHKSVKDELTQKWNKDYINIVYKDNKTGKMLRVLILNLFMIIKQVRKIIRLFMNLIIYIIN